MTYVNAYYYAVLCHRSSSHERNDLINLSPEWDSDDEFDTLILLYSLNIRKKSRESNFIKKEKFTVNLIYRQDILTKRVFNCFA